MTGSILSVYAVGQYEWRRALARKKVSILILFTILVEVLPFAVLMLLPIPSFLANVTKLMWLVGVVTPHSFFLQFAALLIGSGSTAEEYEQGTADLILAKPVSRTSYLLGKFLGGLTLFSFIALLTTLLAVILSTSLFGAQQYVEYAPIIYFTIILSTLVFYSIGFVAGETLRAPGLAYLVASSTFITSLILVPFLTVASSLTGNSFYLDISRALPTWSVQNLPLMTAKTLFLGSNSIPFIFSFTPQIPGTVPEAVTGILIYTAVCVTISFIRFLKTDVTKKSVT
ncbi:MAG: ABC transporter permease [Thaumarchaeota archaeon]|nr:ABC transporter permease [Nitrososphaerota archaeon]MCL5317410.1 ABC transporter permease [Nitrososphaerota archaeon]